MGGYKVIYPQEFGIEPDIAAAYDIITEAHICKVLRDRFGKGIMHGSVLAREEPLDESRCLVYCCEKQLRNYLRDVDVVVEIGTKYGVGTLLPAHYASHAITIDIIPRTEPISVWSYFGVNNKITYAVVEDDKEKAEYLNDKTFDFAILDGGHTYENIKSDFELVKKCGRVLFHEYILTAPKGNPDKFKPTIDFLKTLPKDEVTLAEPFAYWERKDG